jgi:hypothetical protein
MLAHHLINLSLEEEPKKVYGAGSTKDSFSANQPVSTAK